MEGMISVLLLNGAINRVAKKTKKKPTINNLG